MYLRDLMRSLVRRWYLVFTGLVLTGVAAVCLFNTLPVSYHSGASMLLLPPQTATGKDGNPFLQLGGLNQAVDVLTRTLTSDQERKPLLKENPGATFTIAADGTTSGPIFIATSTASTGAESTKMMNDVVAAVPVALATIQSGLSVKPLSQINMVVISQDQKPMLDSKTRIQALAGIIAVGIALTIIITGLIDGLLGSRRRRLAKATQCETAGDTFDDDIVPTVGSEGADNSSFDEAALEPSNPMLRTPRTQP